jgi:hypothetical protein
MGGKLPPSATFLHAQGRERGLKIKVLHVQRDGSGEIRFIRKVLIKERGQEVLIKIRPSLILLEPFKDSLPTRTAVGN